MPVRRAHWLGYGFLLGAAAGLVWTWRRMQQINREGPPGLLDWGRVWEVASRYSQDTIVVPGREPFYAAMVERSIGEVSAYTGLHLPSSSLAIRVLGRRQWLEANLQTFRLVLRPLEEVYERASGPRNPVTVLFGDPVQVFLSHQVGLLLGYLSQRVLGQYDIALLGREPLGDGYLYFVEPNIRGTQAQLGLGGDDFPMWVALHESTHAFEFEAHPWLRAHFNHLLEAYLGDLEPEIDQIGQQLTPAGLARLFDQIRRGGSWLLWALTPRQRQLFDQMQALMCMVEGYSNHVMKRVGRAILPSFDLIEARVAARQSQRSAAERLLARLTGLDLKMEQYELGEKFAEAVVQQRGLPFLNQVWQRAGNLPTMAEIGRPQRWIARMEGRDAPARG